MLRTFSSEEASATGEFCGNLGKFFDCLSVRSSDEHERKRKVFLKPYISVDGERFKWLIQDFIGYLKDWKEAITNRQNEFSNVAREKIFISQQTYEVFQITVYSTLESVRYLLKAGMPLF